MRPRGKALEAFAEAVIGIARRGGTSFARVSHGRYRSQVRAPAERTEGARIDVKLPFAVAADRDFRLFRLSG